MSVAANKLRSIVSRLQLLVLFVAVCFCSASCSTKNDFSYYANNAQLVNKNYYGSNGIPLMAHEIKEGRGSVMAYRKLIPDSNMYDGGSYEQITIWVPVNIKDKKGEFHISDNKARVVFQTGSIEWKKSACYGYANKGTIRYEKISTESYQVNMLFEVTYNRSDSYNERCAKITGKSIERNLSLKSIPNKKLVQIMKAVIEK